jgi:citrate lyase beta subunit
MFITDQADIAAHALACGADWIFFDLELIGKSERQGRTSSWISRHRVQNLAAIRKAIPRGTLLIRLNPLHEGSAAEVDHAVSAGVDRIMLPMFHSAAELQRFSDIVEGRVPIVPLLETPGAVADIEKILRVRGIEAVHIGINDLHIAFKRHFMFEMLIDQTVTKVAAACRRADFRFGIGGVARVDEGLVPARKILNEHARLGSSMAILSRTFHRLKTTLADIMADMDMAAEIAALRQAYADALKRPIERVASDHRDLCASLQSVAERMREKGANPP